MRLLVAGLGSVGQRHVRNLRHLAPVEIAAWRVRGRTLPANLKGEWMSEYSDLGSALAAGPIGALVCNPTSGHLEVALRAAQAGCHLFIEKPLSHSLEGINGLRAVVQEKELYVLVGFQFRFHPGFQTIKRLLSDGAIGKVICANSHWGEYLPSWHPSEDYRLGYSARSELGGGAILTLCHPFDYLRWLVGEVSTVFATAAHLSNLKIDVEDTADILLEFNNGPLGHVHLDYVQSPPRHSCEIIGEKGFVRWDSSDEAVRLFRAGHVKVFRAPKRFERNKMFEAEMRHFLNCLSNKAKPLVTLDDGIRALEIAIAAKQSARERRSIEVKDVEPSRQIQTG